MESEMWMTLQQIEDAALKLPAAERRHLATVLPASPEPPAPGRPVSLRGIWPGKFPEDFDVEQALHEIRTDWLKEWDGEEFVP